MSIDVQIGGSSLPDQNSGLGTGIIFQPQPIDPMDDGAPIGQAGVSEPGIGTLGGSEIFSDPPLALEAVGELQTKGGTDIVLVIAIATLVIAGVSLLARMIGSRNG